MSIKKGLSSSAPISVLRALDRIYDLNMTIRGKMEFAYLGEIMTPLSTSVLRHAGTQPGEAGRRAAVIALYRGIED